MPRVSTLEDFKGKQKYLGPHTVEGGVKKETRWKIVNTGLQIVKAEIPYVIGLEFIWCTLLPDWSDNTWDGSIGDIERLRCDGVVEYAYEKNGVTLYGGDVAEPVTRTVAKPLAIGTIMCCGFVLPVRCMISIATPMTNLLGTMVYIISLPVNKEKV